MTAIKIRNFGDTAEMQPTEIPEPRPAQGEVLIEVKAAGVNYADVLLCRGRYAGQQPLPFVPGFEAAGVVLESGKGVSGWRPGQRVMAAAPQTFFGCYAEKVVLPASPRKDSSRSGQCFSSG